MCIFQLLTLLICALIAGCAHRENGAVLLDNRGGFSHAGRRIPLRADGSYTDTAYTDAVGGERAKRGRYTLNAERTHLVLSSEVGEAQHLYRVDYRGQQYWVRDDDRTRIVQSGEDWLRQISLRVVP